MLIVNPARPPPPDPAQTGLSTNPISVAQELRPFTYLRARSGGGGTQSRSHLPDTNILKLREENQTNTGLREDVERRCRLPAGALHERRTVLDSMVRPVLAQFMDEFVGPAGSGRDDARDDYDDVVWTIAPALPRTPPWGPVREG